MLITLEDLYRAYLSFRPKPDEGQRAAIKASPDAPLYIVAGPGTGKTATLSLRILKLILVDEVPPGGILATTFTVKAAAELRSRVLSWGYRLLEALDTDPQLAPAAKERLRRIDINQVITGTIDSICEEALRRYRDPGTQPPILADEFVARTLLLREGLFNQQRHDDSDLDDFLLGIRGGKRFGWHIGTKTELLQAIGDRQHHDQVDWPAFIAAAQHDEGHGRAYLRDALADYEAGLRERGMVDFTLLEQEMLNRLRADQPADFLAKLRVVLVDEYQDTNLLQEQIYFELAKACGGALTVVGDDDQSLYRFRGATVELFSNFPERYVTRFKQRPEPIFLKTNYRSTKTVVDFVNNFAQLDPSYQRVRAAAKPRLSYGPQAKQGLPILGMFRPDIETLTTDLAEMLRLIFRGSGYQLPDGSTLRRSEGGDVGDCALLCSSPGEISASGERRLPGLLRDELGAHRIEVFNPRGQDLTAIELVARFGGLLLECLDPGGVIEGQTSGLSREAHTTMRSWRDQAINFAESNEAPQGLLAFATGWASRDPGRRDYMWPRSVPVLDLIYGLRHFFTELRDSPEGQVYLEVFTRQVSACEQIGKFSGRVAYNPEDPGLATASIIELMRNLLGPIASGTIGVNEDLLQAFPHDQLSILSIHQSKGLEFPLTIVDIGSDFKSNHGAHAFKRFPKEGGPSQRMEDLLRPHTELKKPLRTGRDRAFDDLYRQYFVAYSRAQEVLLLVGLDSMLSKVQSVAAGWTRDGVARWQNILPFTRI